MLALFVPNNLEKYELLKKPRFCGIEKDCYSWKSMGTILEWMKPAAIHNFKLKKLEKNIEERKNIAEIYYKNLSEEIFSPIPMPGSSNGSYYLVPFYFSEIGIDSKYISMSYG